MKFDYQIRGIVLENRFFHHRSLTLINSRQKYVDTTTRNDASPSERV